MLQLHTQTINSYKSSSIKFVSNPKCILTPKSPNKPVSEPVVESVPPIKADQPKIKEDEKREPEDLLDEPEPKKLRSEPNCATIQPETTDTIGASIVNEEETKMESITETAVVEDLIICHQVLTLVYISLILLFEKLHLILLFKTAWLTNRLLLICTGRILRKNSKAIILRNYQAPTLYLILLLKQLTFTL